MNNQRGRKIFEFKKQHSAHQNGQDDLSSLREELNNVNQEIKDKKQEMLTMSIKLRQEGIQNQKLKRDVMQADERAQMFISKHVEILHNRYKNNKDSPLFYNENGLSPFDLLRIGDRKFQQLENMICMVCYIDLQKGVRVMKLPCSHLLHKQCAIQHLLYSSSCPACQAQLK